MVTIEEATIWTMALPEVVQQPHLEKSSFRVAKKIFATLDVVHKEMVVKLSEVDQSVFTAYNPSIIYPVPGGSGKQGWTIVNLKKVQKAMFKDTLQTAYCLVAPTKLAEQVRKKE